MTIVKTVYDEENSCLDNMPENLSGSEVYTTMEEAVDYLDSAVDELESASQDINNIIEGR